MADVQNRGDSPVFDDTVCTTRHPALREAFSFGMRVARYESPVQGPQGLGWDGEQLWITSCITNCMYAVDPRTLAIQDEVVPPGEVFGLTWTGSVFRAVIGFEDDAENDDRYIYTYAPGSGFLDERIECPDRSGSFLAYDGSTLYLSQAWAKKLIALDDRGVPVREIDLERRPVGMTFVDDLLYIVTVDDEWGDGQFARMHIDASKPVIEPIMATRFAPRSVAYDGTHVWICDRNSHALLRIDV